MACLLDLLALETGELGLELRNPSLETVDLLVESSRVITNWDLNFLLLTEGEAVLEGDLLRGGILAFLPGLKVN